jgi:type II secretory pathway pseudopilin PulG
MVVILLIGVITAVGLPRFLRSPVPVTQDFIHRVNVLMTQAVSHAQRVNESCRIFFNLGARTVELQSAQAKGLGQSLTIPDTLTMTEVVINGESQFQVGSGQTFYFLINSEGISQEVMLYIDEKKGSITRSYSFYLNPFSVQFRVA